MFPNLEFIKTALNAIMCRFRNVQANVDDIAEDIAVLKLDVASTEETIKASTADWNQNDETAIDYVKNRTHWKGPVLSELFGYDGEFAFKNTDTATYVTATFIEITEEETYIVLYDGKEYSCIGVAMNNGVGLGNLSLLNRISNTPECYQSSVEYEDTGEPFAVISSNYYNPKLWYVSENDGNHSISVNIETEGFYKIDEGFLPDTVLKMDPSCIASGDHSRAEGYNTTASGNYSHAEGCSTRATSTDASATSTTSTTNGEYTHAEGYGTVAYGTCSHAEGNGTKASGVSSHAEGTDTIASGNTSHAEGTGTTASETFSHAEGYGTTASGYASHAEGQTTTASGTYSHAEGSTNTASGIASHAEGMGAEASGDYSHAEGDNTRASGNTSHAEGYGASASGVSSHAEGRSTRATSTDASATSTTSTTKGAYTHAEGYGTVAYGTCSHAEGNGTKASGNASHAEGYRTVASGNTSHTEGYCTTASGVRSHAEGSGTTATSKSQHVRGEYNILDTEGSSTTRGKYAHIVGNGTSDSARSNAHTLDWDGNAWFAGDVFVGGSSQDDGVKLLKTGDAIPIPQTASVGQAIAVKAVDGNGKPTEWEAMNIPEQVQPDWNEPDSASHTYIKNKPCYDYIEPSGVIWESNSAGTSGQGALMLVDLVDGRLIKGETYRLTVDGVETTYTCAEDADGIGLYIGAGFATFDGGIFQYHTLTYLYAYTNNLWNAGQKVRLEGPLRRYKKLDVSLYEAPAVDSTLTQSGQAADAEAVGNRLSALSEEKVSLPKAEDGTAIPGTAGWYAVSDGAGGITWVESAPSTGGGGETTTHGIVWDLVNVTSSNNAASVADGASLIAVLTPADGYTLGDVTITMGGTDITATAWDAETAKVTVASVTGDVVITCTAVEQSSGVVDTSPIIAETGYGLSSSGATIANGYLCYTDIYSLGTTLTGGKTRAIKYYIAQSATDGSSGGNNKQCVYLDGSFVNYYTTAFNAESRANYSSAKGDINQVRFTLFISSVDDSWAYFEDTGEIIFAGKNTQYYGMSNIDGTMAGGGSGTASASTLSVDDDYAQDYSVSTLSLVTDESASVAAETGLDAGFAAAIEQAKNAWMLEANGSVDKIPLIIHTDYHGRFSQPLWETISQMVDWYELSRVVNLGDVVDSWADADTDNPLTKCTGLENYLKSMESVPFSKRIEIFGNHDTWKLENSAYTGLTPQNYLRKYFKNIYARGKDNYGNMVVYDDRYNVKYLIISGMAYDAGIGGYSHYVIPTASWDWIIDQLEKADGYDVVVLSHVALGRNGETVINPTGETAEESVGCVDWVARTDFWAARKNKTSGSFNDQYGVSHSYDFSGCDGELLCGLHGHEHADGYYYIGNSLLDVFFDAYYISPNAIHFVLIDRENRRLNVWKVDNTPQVQNYQIPMDQPTT